MIKFGRITLRHVMEEDLPILARQSALQGAIEGAGPAKMTSPHEVRKRFLEDGYSSAQRERLVMCDEADAVIGDVVHFQAKPYSSAREVGWTIHDPAKRGLGYGTEAIKALVDYLFRAYPIHRIECQSAVSNLASIRIAEKCGFTREGVARGMVFVQGEYQDDVLLSILRPEWEKIRLQTPK